MSRTPFILFGIFAAICVIVIPWYALAKEGDESAGLVEVAPEDAEAKELFAQNCGSCHTLAAAGSDGVVGPDLDALLVPTGSNDPNQYDSIYGRVLNAVTCGVAGRMPKAILLDEEAQDVARFVAVYAGQIDKGPTMDAASAKTPAAGECQTAAAG